MTAVPEFSLLRLLRALALAFVVAFSMLMGSFFALASSPAGVGDAAAPSYPPPPLGVPHDAGAVESNNWYAAHTVTAESSCETNPYVPASCSSSPRSPRL